MKVATEMAERTDSDRLLSLFDLSGMEVMWQAWSEDKQAVFTQGFVGQQIDLKRYSKPYR